MAVEPGGHGRDSGGVHHKWIALSNTTLGVLMVTINQSILLISLPDLFGGIHLNPLTRPTPRSSYGRGGPGRDEGDRGARDGGTGRHLVAVTAGAHDGRPTEGRPGAD